MIFFMVVSSRNPEEIGDIFMGNFGMFHGFFFGDTVDGRNPAPLDR